MHEAVPGVVNSMTGAQSVVRWARATPTAVAIIDGGFSYSYADLAGLIVKMAVHLRSFVPGQGTIVGIECSSRYMQLVLILACECLGATTTSLAMQELTSDSDLLKRCDLLCVEAHNITIPRHPNVMRLTLDKIVAISLLAVTDDDYRLLNAAPAPETMVRILKTSGTTGRQKFMGNDRVVVGRIVDMTKFILDSLEMSYNFLCLYQFSFRPSYIDSLLALNFGRTVIFSTVAGFQDDLEMIGNCHTVLLPGDVVGVCAGFKRPANRSFHCAVHFDGGAASPLLRKRLMDTFASAVLNTYSMNETNYLALVDKHGVGTLLPDVSVKIVSDNGIEKLPGETGIVVARSSRMSSAYLWDDALAARHFKDGWHRTSDVGYNPEPGKLVITGRSDDMLNIGGIKVPPQPIEDEIKKLDGVRDAVLLGIEDDQGILTLHLFVERTGAVADTALENLIQPIVHHYGKGFTSHFVDVLPRTDTRKVQRSVLRQGLRGLPS